MPSQRRVNVVFCTPSAPPPAECFTLTMESTPDSGAGDGTATATPVGGVGPFTYLWSDAQTTQTAVNLEGGIEYTVTVTDTGAPSCVVNGEVGVNGPDESRPSTPATVSYSATKAILTTDWSSTMSFPGFDASLGTLTGVSWNVDQTFRSSSRIENLDGVARNGTVHGANGTFTAKAPVVDGNYVLVTQTLQASFTNNLTAYDGVTDYSGTSGVSAARKTVTGSLSNPDVTDISWYTTPSTLVIPITGTAVGFATGPTSYSQQIGPDMGCTLTVTYSYDAPVAGGQAGGHVGYSIGGDAIGITVNLLSMAGALIATTFTDASGYYNFTDLPGNYYKVQIPSDPSYTGESTIIRHVAWADVITDIDFTLTPV